MDPNPTIVLDDDGDAAAPLLLHDAIDVDELNQAQSRFLAHHCARLLEAKDRLPPTSRYTLSALPLLLHVNHPALPGYAGQNVPVGICNYTPSTDCIRAIRFFHTHYRHTQTQAVDPAILGIYFMGSAGSVAHTRSSDLDIWVCLEKRLHRHIQPKLDALTAWAAQLGVELQCFAVDPGQFTGGTELAYSPLLLDEFYRTACYVAGQMPLWWLIASRKPGTYRATAQALQRQKYVRPGLFLDFGPVESFSATELFAAGVRELERSLQTLHKSLLKLALLESYHSGYSPLSQRYKDNVNAGVSNEQNDGYLVLARQLNAFFSALPGAQRRLSFMRKAWLTKTGRGNTHLTRNPAWWQLAQQWGYDEARVAQLRWPAQWSIAEIIQEHHLVMAEFAHALSFLNALQHACPDESQQVRPYALRLQALRHKILTETHYNDRLLDAIVPRNYAGNARITKHGCDNWSLCEDDQTLIRRPRLAQILLWLHRQGFPFSALASSQVELARYREIYNGFEQGEHLVLLNAQAGALAPEQGNGDFVISANDDPFCYGMNQDCLVQHVDYLQINRFNAPEAQHWHHLTSAFAELVNRADADIVCIGDVRHQSISRHLLATLQQARSAIRNPGDAFALRVAKKLCFFMQTPARSTIFFEYDNAYQAFRELPAIAGLEFARQDFNYAAFDWLQSLEALAQPTLLVGQWGEKTRIVYRDQSSLQQISPLQRPLDHLAQSLTLFSALLKRRGVEAPQILLDNAKSGPERVAPNDIDEPLRYRLTVAASDHGWVIQCGQDTWLPQQLDIALLSKLRKQVLNHRVGTEPYPVYLTDLSLPGTGFATHLLARFALETALNTSSAAALEEFFALSNS